MRRVIALSMILLGGLVASAPAAWAAAEVHRLSLILSSNPTQLVGGDFNDLLDDYNQEVLNPRGLETLDKISNSWYQQAELRYFVRPNVSVSAGFGYIRSITRLEYLPRLSESIHHRVEVLSVPVHVGAAYYLAPYNQGDFQARAYLGGGFLSYTGTKVVFERLEFGTDDVTTLAEPDEPRSFRVTGERDGPGYYLEAGAHMFFAVRYSVMLGVIYRRGAIRDLALSADLYLPDGQVVTVPLSDEETFSIDLGGVGARMGVGIGF
jgi:hypothetical protein